MESRDQKLVVLPHVSGGSYLSEEGIEPRIGDFQLNVEVANQPVLVGNQIQFSADGCPGAMFAAVINVQHNHYGPEPNSTGLLNPDAIVDETCSSTNSTKVLPDLDQVKRKLQEEYIRIWMKPQPALDGQPISNFYVQLKYTYLDLSGTGHVAKKLILDDVVGIISYDKKYVLVTGEPGCGKSVLLTKIAYDWATGDQPALAAYEFVFLYKLKNLPRYKSLEEEFKAELSQLFDEQLCSEAQCHLLEIFRTKKTLVLLDGYNELSEGGMTTLREELLRNSVFSGSTFVVTSREDVNSVFLKTFQHRIRFSEIGDKTRDRIIQKYFDIWSDDSKHFLLRKFVKKKTFMSYFFSSNRFH